MNVITSWPAWFCWRSCSGKAQARGASVSLQPGKVLTLRQPATLRVVSGVIWLTGTPAADAVLPAGAQFELKRAFPFVMEALEPAEFILE